MIFECNTHQLKDAVSKTQRFTATTTTLPVLKNIFISAQESQLTIRATNLDIGCEISIPVKGKGKKTIIIPPPILNQTLGVITDPSIQLKIEETALTLITKNGVYTIQGHTTEDFPTLPVIKNGEVVVIPIELFTQNTNKVSFAAAVTELKPEIASVYYSIKNNIFTCVATDGFRLAEKTTPWTSGGSLNHIIPIRCAQEIATIFDGQSGELSLCINETECAFTSGSITIITRVVHGIYPDYPQLIPHTYQTEFRVARSDLLTALKASSLYSERTNHVVLRIDPSITYCEIESKNSSVGEGLVKLEGESTGEALELTINSRYLLEALSPITQPTVFIGCNGRGKPLLVRGDGVQDFSYLLMPINR